MVLNLINKRDFIKLLDWLLLPHKFIRAKDNWYLNNGECIAIIGLGKSVFGGQFSIGIDIFLKEIDPDLLPFPQRHLCHFRGFDVKFMLPAGEVFRDVLNLENELPPADRISDIITAINQYALPFIIPLDSKQALALAYRGQEDFKAYCNLDLKLVLERTGYLTKEELELDF